MNQHPNLTASLRSLFGDTAFDAEQRVQANFQTEVDVREYLTIGMCQRCQDRYEQECKAEEERQDAMEDDNGGICRGCGGIPCDCP